MEHSEESLGNLVNDSFLRNTGIILLWLTTLDPMIVIYFQVFTRQSVEENHSYKLLKSATAFPISESQN